MRVRTNKSYLRYISELGSGKSNGMVAKFWIDIETVNVRNIPEIQEVSPDS